MSVDESAVRPGASAAVVGDHLSGLPRPTSGRILTVVLALLGIGFTAGNQIHNSVAGDAWLAAVRACSAATPGGTTLGSTEATDLTHCLAPVERVHALYVAAGAGLMVLAAGVFIGVAPSVIRRRKRLTTVGLRGQAATDRLGELAARIGLRRPPVLHTAGPSQRDAFCFGRPGAPAIALPLGLITGVYRRPEFEPVVLHELAHIKHRDVALSWLARSFLAIALITASVPVVVGAVTNDLTVLPDYLWRIVAIIGLGWFIARAVLRVREFDADLTASSVGGADALREVLAGPTARPSPSGIRGYLHHHPTAAERLQVLGDPGRIAEAGFLSGFVPAALVGALLPSIKSVATVALTGVDTLAWLVPGAVLGALLLAVSVGIDVIRSARVEAGTRRLRLHDARLCLGTAVGVTFGQVISPEAAWKGLTGGAPAPTVLLSALLVCGATAAACGIARAVVRRRIKGLGCVLLTALPWGFAIWLGQMIQVTSEAGLEFVRFSLTFNGLSWPAAAMTLAVLAALSWALSRHSASAALLGVVAAIAGSGALIAASLLGPAVNDELGAVTLYAQGVDQAVLAALAAVAVLAITIGVRGAAAGGIAALVAALTATVLFGGYLWSRGNTISMDLLIPMGMPLLTYPVGVWLAVAPVGLVVARRTRVPPLRTQLLLAGALATTLVAIGIGIGPFLAPEPRSLLAPAESQEVLADDKVIVTAEDYRNLLAPGLNDQFETLLAAIDLHAEAAPDPAAADWLTTQVASSVHILESQLDQITGADDAVASVHAGLVTAVDELAAYCASTAEYHRGGASTNSRQALAHRQQAIDDHRTWLRGISTL